MAESAGNVIRVSDLPDKGFEPLDFRYLALTAHYRSKLDFTEEAMQAAASGLRRLRRAAGESDDADASAVDLAIEPMAGYRARFVDADQRRPRHAAALAVAHAVAGADDLDGAQRRALLLDFDRVLGLSLDAPAPSRSPSCRRVPLSCSSSGPPHARPATSRPRIGCATSWRRWGSRCATRPTARRPPSAADQRMERPRRPIPCLTR